jgi:hypothetical protein
VTAEDTGRNIWLVLLDHAIAGRERSEIAMQGIRAYFREGGHGAGSRLVGDDPWRRLLVAGFGYAAAIGVNSEYRELGGSSRRYPTMILPIA